MTQYLREIAREAYYSVFHNTGGPGTAITVLMLLGAVAVAAWTFHTLECRWHIFGEFTGTTRANGLKRLWMFNAKPYLSMIAVTGTLAGSFIAVCLAVMLFGLVVLVLFWAIKILLIILVWLGYGAILIGALAIYGRELSGIAGILIGCPIVAFEDTFHEWGDNFAAWGEATWASLNLFDWLWSLASGCGQLVAVVAMAPLAAFLLLALAVIVIDGVAMAAEWAVMRYYRVHQRCPQCGATDCDYIVQGHIHPVPLRPGVYGIFHHRYQGVDVPTMMLNGKGALARQCRSCGHRISMKRERHAFGTDLHTGFVGAPSTGKSWLIYGLLYRLLVRAGGRARQVDATKDTDIDRMHRLMESDRSFQTVATQYTHAVQVMIDRLSNRVPWHLYWWDVAGENFDRALQATELDFYRHVTSIVFVIDPLLTDYRPEEPGQALAAWLRQHNHRPVTSLDDTLSHLMTILGRYGRDTRDIHVTVVLVKADKGYIDKVTGKPYTRATADTLRAFVATHMRQQNLVTNLDNLFASVTYKAMSVTDGITTDDDAMLDHLLAIQGVTLQQSTN